LQDGVEWRQYRDGSSCKISLRMRGTSLLLHMNSRAMRIKGADSIMQFASVCGQRHE